MKESSINLNSQSNLTTEFSKLNRHLPNVLTIQSHVAYGHVGNAAATLPMQLLKIQPIVINTVQFSNHTGYGEFKGQVFTASHIEDVLSGLEARGVLENCHAVLSGYLGDADIGEVILKSVQKIRKQNPSMIYLCDPVMGDIGRGIFVRPGIPEFLKHSALREASIITPNHFEYELLAEQTFTDLNEIITHAKLLIKHNQHLHAVVITSLRLPDLPPEKLETLLVTEQGACLVETPYHDLEPLPNGMGDTLSAILLSHILNGKPIEEATALAVSSLYSLVSHTIAGERDLPLIANQSDIHSPSPIFEIKRL
ncbi:pyridoxal kinase PdxY [Thorsellia anophelis]|uniref:pyridoxal kinase n=1 Tax=Thorsellia anophelis DSM 18579 TaxID=1123402 RepID=A0A1H9Z0A6_9GAMM|nr:pyridoxal kinase PdxY [Thorsellia anophelis]SES74291.1 pyridoxine kinase [Thorsellia anophelis DSM 18579]